MPDGKHHTPLGRLTRRADFLRVRRGRSWRTPSLVLQSRTSPDSRKEPCARFGFTASKRLGAATKRNRARRRLKEAVRLIAGCHARPGYDYVVIARQAVLSRPFGEIQEELRTALRRVHERGSTGPGASPAG